MNAALANKEWGSRLGNCAIVFLNISMFVLPLVFGLFVQSVMISSFTVWRGFHTVDRKVQCFKLITLTK